MVLYFRDNELYSEEINPTSYLENGLENKEYDELENNHLTSSSLKLGLSKREGLTFSYKGFTIQLRHQNTIVEFPNGKIENYETISKARFENGYTDNDTDAEIALHVAMHSYHKFYSIKKEHYIGEKKESKRSIRGNLEDAVESFLGEMDTRSPKFREKEINESIENIKRKYLLAEEKYSTLTEEGKVSLP